MTSKELVDKIWPTLQPKIDSRIAAYSKVISEAVFKRVIEYNLETVNEDIIKKAVNTETNTQMQGLKESLYPTQPVQTPQQQVFKTKEERAEAIVNDLAAMDFSKFIH